MAERVLEGKFAAKDLIRVDAKAGIFRFEKRQVEEPKEASSQPA